MEVFIVLVDVTTWCSHSDAECSGTSVEGVYASRQEAEADAAVLDARYETAKKAFDAAYEMFASGGDPVEFDPREDPGTAHVYVVGKVLDGNKAAEDAKANPP